jgi:hypothetical protein
VHGNDRRVEGVRVSTPEGEYDCQPRGHCVAAASGNAEVRARYLGTIRSHEGACSKRNTGGVPHAACVGVKSAGHWQGAHISPIDGRRQTSRRR